MIAIGLVLVGVIFLLYAAVICHSLLVQISLYQKNNSNKIILGFIYFFILGYLAFIAQLVTLETHGLSELIVSAIFFFGALFVVVVIKVIAKLMLGLIENNSKLEHFNIELKSKNDELKQSEDKYVARSKELEATLEDFYTLRIGMEKQLEKGVVEEENIKIKSRLDALKNGI